MAPVTQQPKQQQQKPTLISCEKHRQNFPNLIKQEEFPYFLLFFLVFCYLLSFVEFSQVKLLTLCLLLFQRLSIPRTRTFISRMLGNKNNNKREKKKPSPAPKANKFYKNVFSCFFRQSTKSTKIIIIIIIIIIIQRKIHKRKIVSYSY